MPRGTKLCSSCQSANGPRSHSCKNCGQSFSFKAKSKEQKNTKIIKDIDWRTLQKGDRIKVGGGPYFMKGAESISMGYRGKFVVYSLDDNGIIATGIDRHSGYAHIYMGRDIQNKETNVWKIKHRLVKLKSKTEIVS